MGFMQPPKPDDWTESDLYRYCISVVTRVKQEFFGVAHLPAPVIPSLTGFMTTEDREHAADGETKKLLHYLDLVLDPQIGQEAVVHNFAAKLLEKLGYDEGERIIFIQRALPIVSSGVSYITQADVCVMDKDNQILLILQTSLPSLKDPEPQIVVKAIAAYEANNKVRATSLSLPPLSTITFPAISMIGTNIIFYKITVTSGLSAAFQQRRCPGWEDGGSLVQYVPVLPQRHGLGMRPLENRVEILACMEAFKQFMGK